MKDSEFIEELDVLAQDQFSQLRKSCLNISIDLIEVKFIIEVPQEFIDKYHLNNDISFVLSVKGSEDTAKMEYYYRKRIITPEGFYIRPDNYHKVPILTILQQAIAQDNDSPSIKDFENGTLEDFNEI